MPRKKLKKILEVDSLPNVFAATPGTSSLELKTYLNNDRPFTLEIGCGRGDYTISLAQQHQNRNFVGVDLKGARLWTGSHLIDKMDVHNVAFLRAAAENLADYFAAGEIDEIWIPFPDPFPKKRGSRRRITAPRFLEVYHKILRPGGLVHLKTDDQDFFEFTREILAQQNLVINASSEDVYQSSLDGPVTTIQTKYERAHLAQGKKIKYLCFGFQESPLTPTVAASADSLHGI